MPFNTAVTRGDASALIPEDVTQEIISGAEYQSAAMQLFMNRRMSRKTQRMPVLAALAQAYFVNGDTGLKQTSKVAWENKYLNAEPIATIVPIPKDVLDDTDYDLWNEIQPLCENAVAITLDGAVFFGTDKPASWPDSVEDGAIAAGNTYVIGTTTQAGGGIGGDINEIFGKVEDDGFDVSGIVARTGMKRKFRGATDTTGQALVNVNDNTVHGASLQYVMQGQWPTGGAAGTNPDLIAGDFGQGIVAVRSDIEVMMLDQAVITDNTNAIMYNLPQQDMVAMRMVARYAYSVANPINYENTNAATRFPFAVGRS